jgi:hypothetical protein
MASKAATEFDFGSFSSREVHDEGFDVQILKPDGEPSGFVVRVAGPESERRKKVERAKIRERLSSGKRVAVTAEQIENFPIDEAVAATISWQYPDGFNGPSCTPENARKIYKDHADIREQVLSAANNLANFTKASRTN